jgi:hypothetical protein
MMIAVAERWREIEGYGGAYQVSDQGRVRSISRERPGRDGSVRKIRGTVLSPRVRENGLHCVNLWEGNEYQQVPVNRLVLEAFRGPAPDNHEPENKDGDRANNRLSNLKWKPTGGLALLRRSLLASRRLRS